MNSPLKLNIAMYIVQYRVELVQKVQALPCQIMHTHVIEFGGIYNAFAQYNHECRPYCKLIASQRDKLRSLGPYARWAKR